ncbi:MAG TPA: hypothetical protein DEU03_19770 [Bacillus sp. (in: Bacteria)]|nr:hypothetical protein CON87_23930 [Bacillus cereus]HCF55321.1 hypothetical protein [Bacillus sp. (in: firmicutes)]PET07421.1 hypothetical protein CN516_21685 [Bacillus cereus]PEV85848.1 hypothetical protein CN433_19635 [Bacillus cereus]PFP46796.1 hypothetical protein COJ98_22540 [Bacillus cereus]
MTILFDIAEVTRGEYCKWIKRQLTPSEKQLEDTGIKKKILECNKNLRGFMDTGEYKFGRKPLITFTLITNVYKD